LQDAPSIREMEAKNGPFSVSATFALTNKPVNALWEWSKVRSGGALSTFVLHSWQAAAATCCHCHCKDSRTAQPQQLVAPESS